MVRTTALLAASALLLSACNGDDAPDEEPVADEYAIEDQPDDAAASFVSPEDGDTVDSPFTVELDAENVTLTEVGDPAAGEAHLHVTADIGCYETGDIIPGPSDEDEAEGRFHLGDGSDSRSIELEPGTYELCVQLADGVHRAFGETETITVTVE
ncbi:DUF4399 domain-containing protein [Nitriliruptor alkaliphilus]|uniref:DUF4399 domain-containing protein n=1 Tax=Nitriliruptor alkaliphilus TaxID=427918 RepID=UPI000698F93F|nr:DUF4399 domain-containing protein [Nitriliruptor alkaliphilus]